MLEWLTGKKKRGVLPEYSRLRAEPTRALPTALVSEEAGEPYAARRDAIGRGLRAPPHQPREEIPLFTELITSDGSGLVTIPLPDASGHCLPVFSTPFRAADYNRTLLTSVPAVQYLASSTLQLLGMIRDVESIGVTTLALDRCPRCSTFTSVNASSIKTAPDLLELWTIHKATELARLDLYFQHAIKFARAGNVEAARDVALETVGHVGLEDPRPHLLLGELAVALADQTMLREAKDFLLYLKHESWHTTLERIADAGQPTFKQADYGGAIQPY